MKKFVFGVTLLVFCLTAAVCFAAPGYDDQLGVIAANSGLWKQTDEFGSWGFTVTDLDQNGRLEIISASTQGTGMYTLIKIFEVSDEGNTLTEITQDRPEYESSPDIMYQQVQRFYDPESGHYYYIFNDFIRNGFAENYQKKLAVSLEDGVWKETPLAVKSTIYTDAEHFTVTAKDADGNDITEEQFEQAEKTTFSQCESDAVCLEWIMTDTESFAALGTDELLSMLQTAGNPVCPEQLEETASPSL